MARMSSEPGQSDLRPALPRPMLLSAVGAAGENYIELLQDELETTIQSLADELSAAPRRTRPLNL